MSEKNKIIRLDWEKDIHYNYRIETGRIIFKLGDMLKQIEEVSKNKNFNQMKIINEEFKKGKNKLNKLKVPEIYTKIHEFLINCVNAYITAGNVLNEGLKNENPNEIYKASRYIKEGNCWFELAKIYIYSKIEEMGT